MVNNGTNHAAVKTGLMTGLSCIAAAILLSIMSGPTSAATPHALGEILSKTEANYQNIQAFTAVFQQQTTSSAGGTTAAGEASGKLYYSKPHQMRWDYDKPEEQVFVANNQLAWLYVRAENQVTMFDAGKLFSSPLARTFFDGAVGLKNSFDIMMDSTRSTAGSAVLKMVPKQEDPSVKLLYLWIDLPTYRISRIESHDILGNINRIVIESFTPHASVDSKLFRFDVPVSAKVFDSDGRELSQGEVERLRSGTAQGK